MEEQYPSFLRSNRLRSSDLRHLRDASSNLRYKPLISILVPATDPEQLWRALDASLDQVYPEWELCVGCGEPLGKRVREILSGYEGLNGRTRVAHVDQGVGVAVLSNAALSLATGEFVGVLNCGDGLAPDALFEVAKALQDHPHTDLVYTDEDSMDGEGNRSRPRFKPGWSPDLLLSTDYVSSLSLYRRSVLEEVGGFREELDGGHGHDLALRVTERGGGVLHVPRVLYHRLAPAGTDGSHAKEMTRRAVSEALKRRGLKGSVEDGMLPECFRVRLEIQGEPKVSLVIPTRDNVSMLKNCVESIERLTDYPNYEILIVDNDSMDPETVEYLASTRHRVVQFREPFNYSRINNFAVARAEGEYVLLLNDDTEVVSGGWLEAMLEHAQRPEVGAVGARLLYPDGRVQHAGVLVGVGNPWGPGVALHAHQFYPADSPGCAGTAMTTTNYSAVTAACMLLRRSVFKEVGGLNEEKLRVAFNDVDLCLKIRERGYLITYTPHAELLHQESVSRGYSGDPSEALYMRERWGKAMDNDPYYNRNFSRSGGDFNLRADLLRPRVLRQRSEPDSEELFASPLTMSREELEEYVKSRQRSARSSARNTIVPIPKPKNERTPILESLELLDGIRPQRDVQPREASASPANRAGGDSGEGDPIQDQQLVWIFGSPRTGSTWLSRIMAELEDQERWHEPYVGLLFGSFLYERLGQNNKLLNNPSFIMGEAHRKVWLRSIKNFVFEGAAARYPRLGQEQFLVIKEPNGSVGAPLLLEATPGSRLIFLLRDPRDVVASRLDAFKEGSWSSQQRDYSKAEELEAFTKHLAEDYLRVVSQVQRAFDAHPGRKTLVRYEDLRHDTAGTIGAMYRALGIGFDRRRLEAAVAKHSWEQIPQADKGTGKFYRKAQPGSWREDLSADQASLVEEITAPVLDSYYRQNAAGQTFSG